MFKNFRKIAKSHKILKRLIARREELIKLEDSIRYLITVSCGEEEKHFEDQLRKLEDEQFLYNIAIVNTKIEIEDLIAS